MLQPPCVQSRYYILSHRRLGDVVGCYGEAAGNPYWDVMYVGTFQGESVVPDMEVIAGPFTIEALIDQAAVEDRFATVMEALREENPLHPLLKEFEEY